MMLSRNLAAGNKILITTAIQNFDTSTALSMLSFANRPFDPSTTLRTARGLTAALMFTQSDYAGNSSQKPILLNLSIRFRTRSSGSICFSSLMVLMRYGFNKLAASS